VAAVVVVGTAKCEVRVVGLETRQKIGAVGVVHEGIVDLVGSFGVVEGRTG
jgi:hypothetical protein